MLVIIEFYSKMHGNYNITLNTLTLTFVRLCITMHGSQNLKYLYKI
jgi:hypothetical protein